MSYFFTKTLNGITFDEAIERTTTALQSEGFGVLTEIDVQATLKKKIDADIRKYRILGACSPRHAFRAISEERHIGLMLPCNVLVQEAEGGIEISAVDPVASMQSIQNSALGEVAQEVQSKLKAVIEKL